MSVHCYFEDGPEQVAGTARVMPDAPPTLVWTVPEKLRVDQFGTGIFGSPKTMDITNLTYHRERAPHRDGCVCYWVDTEARDRAAFEDTMYLDSVEEIS